MSTDVTKDQKVGAMVSLLGDRSIRIRNRVAVELEKMLPAIAPELESLLNSEVDPLVRERLTLLLRLRTV